MAQALAITATQPLLGRSPTAARSATRAAALVVGGALLVALSAQISIPLPFTPVPLTAQTFAVVLVGASLGAGLGLASLALYLLLGLAGLPFYAGHSHGITVITGATGGYLIGFLLAATVTGALANRGWDRRFGSSLGAMLTGNVLIYLVALPWLAGALHAGVLEQKVLLAGLYPFIPGDIIKVYLAAAVLPAAWRVVGRRPSGESRRARP